MDVVCCNHCAMGQCSHITLDKRRASAQILFVDMHALQGRGYVHASSHVTCVGCINVYHVQVKPALRLVTLNVPVCVLSSCVKAAKTVPT